MSKPTKTEPKTKKGASKVPVKKGVNQGFNRPGVTHTSLRQQSAAAPLAEVPKRATGSRCYCWTVNNPTEEEVFTLANTFMDAGNCIRFICWGEEIGEDDKTPHLQGYMEITKAGIIRSFS